MSRQGLDTGAIGRAATEQLARVVCAHCAHNQPMTVHCVVHYLGRCSWTLFMGTVQKKKKNTKSDPRELGRLKISQKWYFIKALMA